MWTHDCVLPRVKYPKPLSTAQIKMKPFKITIWLIGFTVILTYIVQPIRQQLHPEEVIPIRFFWGTIRSVRKAPVEGAPYFIADSSATFVHYPKMVLPGKTLARLAASIDQIPEGGRPSCFFIMSVIDYRQTGHIPAEELALLKKNLASRFPGVKVVLISPEVIRRAAAFSPTDGYDEWHPNAVEVQMIMNLYERKYPSIRRDNLSRVR